MDKGHQGLRDEIQERFMQRAGERLLDAEGTLVLTMFKASVAQVIRDGAKITQLQP